MADPKMNTLVPMQSQDGDRCMVNAWDVATKKADGWQVIGDLAFHTSSTKAPVDLLDPKVSPKPDPSVMGGSAKITAK